MRRTMQNETPHFFIATISGASLYAYTLSDILIIVWIVYAVLKVFNESAQVKKNHPWLVKLWDKMRGKR